MNRWILTILLAFSFGWASIVQAHAENVSSRFELYSWKEGKEWNFSLLPAAKDRKIDTEIKHGNETLHGLDKMKEKLGNLREGDRIAWQERTESGFIYPPRPVIEEISDYADSVGVKVSVPR